MRTLLVHIAFLLCASLALPARGEEHVFVVANDPDGYGIDRCLAAGERCGTAAANAYCKTQAFSTAAAFHKVSHVEITGSVAPDVATGCSGSSCPIDAMVAIVCIR
jgi:hypothetical protein